MTLLLPSNSPKEPFATIQVIISPPTSTACAGWEVRLVGLLLRDPVDDGGSGVLAL